MFKLLIIALIAIIATVSATAPAIDSVMIGGDAGSVIYTHQSDNKIQAEGNYNSNYETKHLITLGYTGFDAASKTNSKYHLTKDSSITVKADGATLASNDNTMEDQRGINGEFTTGVNKNESVSPTYQIVNDRTTQMSYGADYSSETIVDDANMTTSARGKGDVGTYTAQYSSLAQQKFGQDSDEINFQISQKGRAIYTSKDGKGLQGYLEHTYTDHSKAIMAANNTTSEESSNVTVVTGENVTVNSSVTSDA